MANAYECFHEIAHRLQAATCQGLHMHQLFPLLYVVPSAAHDINAGRTTFHFCEQVRALRVALLTQHHASRFLHGNSATHESLCATRKDSVARVDGYVGFGGAVGVAAQHGPRFAIPVERGLRPLLGAVLPDREVEHVHQRHGEARTFHDCVGH